MKNDWIANTRLLLLGVISSIAFGQPAENTWSNLSRLRDGQKIEVVDMKLKNVAGSFVAYSDDSISLLVGSARISIPQADVLRVTNRGSSHRKRNALIGLGVGAGIAMGVGAAKLGTNHETGELPAYAVVAPIGGVIGAAVGAALPAGKATVYRAKARSNR